MKPLIYPTRCSPECASLQRMNARHFTALAGKMRRNNDLGQFVFDFRSFKLVFQAFHAHVIGTRINIDKINLRTASTGHNWRLPQRCSDSSTANPPAQAPQGEAGNVQRAGGAVDRHGVPCSAVIGNGLLEGRDFRPLGQPARAQCFHHGKHVPAVYRLSPVRNHRRVGLKILPHMELIQNLLVDPVHEFLRKLPEPVEQPFFL